MDLTWFHHGKWWKMVISPISPWFNHKTWWKVVIYPLVVAFFVDFQRLTMIMRCVFDLSSSNLVYSSINDWIYGGDYVTYMCSFSINHTLPNSTCTVGGLTLHASLYLNRACLKHHPVDLRFIWASQKMIAIVCWESLGTCPRPCDSPECNNPPARAPPWNHK